MWFNEELVKDSLLEAEQRRDAFVAIGLSGPAHMCGQCATICVLDGGAIRKATPAEEFKIRMISNPEAGLAVSNALRRDVYQLLVPKAGEPS